MAGSGPLRVAIVGCGNISQGYAKTMAEHPQAIQLLGAFDIDPARAEALTAQFGGRAYGSLDEVLADERVEVVVNLTIHQAHVEVITRALSAGKHVLTEKPIALDPAEAQQLVALARRVGRRLAAAPTVFMGEAQQTAWKLVRDGRLGTVRIAYAEMNWNRIEAWHPNPEPFYQVGAMYDVGVYPITLLTTMFGPVKRVTGFGKVLWPDRTTKEGRAFRIDQYDWMCGLLEFASGPIARVTASFYVGATHQVGLELHGDIASLHIPAPHDFSSPVKVRPIDKYVWTDEPHVREPYKGVDWARGVVELHDAIRSDRPQRATGEQAAHVVEIIAGIHRSAQDGHPIDIASRFTSPPPMEWAM